MIHSPAPRSATRIGAAVVVALFLGLLLAGCSPGDSDASGSGATSLSSVPAGSPPEPAPTSPVDSESRASSSLPDDTAGPSTSSCPDPGDEGDLAPFGTAVVVVRPVDGPTIERCVLVADRDHLRAIGLMGITDLGPYAGMVFAYAADSEGGYWMRDTPMPLTIAWISAEGDVVSTTDMAPCLDAGSACPSYEPGGRYRWAVEVPQGQLDEFGLTPGATLDVDRLPVGQN